MTEDEAKTLAAKREQHKPKSMTHKRWDAVHNSVKGWHVALVDIPQARPETTGSEDLATLNRIGLAIQLFGVEATVSALAHISRERDRNPK